MTERQLDLLIDKVSDLNPDTPKLKWLPTLIPSLLFNVPRNPNHESHLEIHHHHQHDGGTDHEREIDILTITSPCYDHEKLMAILGVLPPTVYRIKGVFPKAILNWAFGRWTWTDYEMGEKVRVTVMGVELADVRARIEECFKGGMFDFIEASQRGG